jgi:hypothetical protein
MLVMRVNHGKVLPEEFFNIGFIVGIESGIVIAVGDILVVSGTDDGDALSVDGLDVPGMKVVEGGVVFGIAVGAT